MQDIMKRNEKLVSLENDSIIKELEKEFTIYNTFNVLWGDQIKSEIFHSDFLAWLFNPYESHGFGSLFLQSFLETVADKNPITFDLNNLSYKTVRIIREYNIEGKEIDIGINFTDNNVLIFIENKLFDKKKEKQLNDYEKLIKKRFNDNDKLLLVFLSFIKEKTKNKEWISIDYSLIEKIINSLITHKNIQNNVASLLEDYLVLLAQLEPAILIENLKHEETIEDIFTSVTDVNFRNKNRTILKFDENKTNEYINFYRKHQKVLDRIFNFKLLNSDKNYLGIEKIESTYFTRKITSKLRTVLQSIINSKKFQNKFNLSTSTNYEKIKFHSKELDDFIKGRGHKSSNNLIYFSMWCNANKQNKITIRWYIGNKEKNKDYTNLRTELIENVNNVFSKSIETRSTSWEVIDEKVILDNITLKSLTKEEFKTIRKKIEFSLLEFLLDVKKLIEKFSH